MPRGYPGTRTCKNCEDCVPADYNFCPTCGNDMFAKVKRKKKHTPQTCYYCEGSGSLMKTPKHCNKSLIKCVICEGTGSI